MKTVTYKHVSDEGKRYATTFDLGLIEEHVAEVETMIQANKMGLRYLGKEYKELNDLDLTKEG